MDPRIFPLHFDKRRALPKLVAAGFDSFKFHSARVLVLAPIVVVLVGFAACYMPVRRAMGVDPIVALRYEYAPSAKTSRIQETSRTVI
jgi:hypothetical protein